MALPAGGEGGSGSGFLKGILDMGARMFKGRGGSRAGMVEAGRYDSFEKVKPLSKSASSPNPIARSGHRVWSDGSFLYSLGGYNPDEISDTFSPDPDDYAEQNSPLLQELWRLNLITDSWERVETSGHFPKTMASFAMAHDPIGGRLLVFGGTAIPFGNTASNELHALSLGGLKPFQWSEIHLQGTSPDNGYGQALVRVSDEDFYLIGGTSGFQYNMLVHKLSVWRDRRDDHFGGSAEAALKGSQCEVRYRHEALLHKGKILVFGGGTREQCISLKNLDAFELSSGLWGAVATLPDPKLTGEDGGGFPNPRRCHSLVHHGDRAVVIGGFDGERMYDDVWLLHLGDSGEGPFQWEKHQATLPHPLYFHSAAVTEEGCVLVFGGVLDAHGARRSADVFRLWLHPPSLQWIAARRLLSSNPHLLSRSKEELRRLGIPIAMLHWAMSPDNPA